MLEFFRGWRRKVGIVTLLMSIAFLGMWFRSRVVEDALEIAFWDVLSQNGTVSWRLRSFVARAPWFWSYPLPPSGKGLGGHFELRLRYGTLVLFFTVLSAYLLLWKPWTVPPRRIERLKLASAMSGVFAAIALGDGSVALLILFMWPYWAIVMLCLYMIWKRRDSVMRKALLSVVVLMVPFAGTWLFLRYEERVSGRPT
jgi:hypothetical protein